ncbi:MAG: lamin tail domain-containing protein [Dermatophilaceae bacterium]
MLPRPVLASLAVTLTTLAAVVTGAGAARAVDATPAPATPAVMISYIRYDSPGSDTGTNLSLNAEYVIIKNTTTTARVITGWTLRDKTGYTFRFPTFTLKAGASVTVHTGKGTPSTTHQYYGKTWYVWNNTGDAAYLRNAAGTLVHSCTWTALGTGAKYC